LTNDQAVITINHQSHINDQPVINFNGEHMQQSTQNKHSLWQLLKPYKPTNKSFFYLVTLILVTTSLELMLPLYSSYLVDSIGDGGIDYLIIIGLIAIVLTAALFEGFLGWYGGHIGHGISAKLRYSLIGRLLTSQSQSLDNDHSAELSARVVNDSKEVKSVLAEDLIGLISGLVSLIAVISIMFILDWRLTLVLISCVLLGFIIITPIALMMNNIGKASQTAEANLLKYLTEWLRYGQLIKSHNGAPDMQRQSKVLVNECLKQEMRATTIASLIGPIANLTLMISMIAILAFSAYWLSKGSMTLGTVTAFLLYLFGLTFPLMSMAMFFSNLNRAIGASSRLSEISQLPIEQSSGKQKVTNIQSLSLQELNFIRGDKTILDRVSCHFDGAGLAMVIGESGSGKTTLMSQFLGFYPETHKQVFINDQPLDDFDLTSIRQAISWVDQEPKLLHATIRDNLTLGLDQPLTDETLIETLESVGLHTWLLRIDNDLSTTVSEQAHQFSGGEKQRFAIARAILRQAKVLLLDEPTSALDHTKKSELMTLLRKLALDRRVIMICHHLELIKPSDDIIEMIEGKAVVTVN